MKNNEIEILLGGGGFIGTNYQNLFPDKTLIIIDKNFQRKFDKDFAKNFYYLNIDITQFSENKEFIDLFNKLIKDLSEKGIKEIKVTVHSYAANLGISSVINDNKYTENEIKLQYAQFEINKLILSLLKDKINNEDDKESIYYQFNMIYYSTSEVYGDADFMQEYSYLKIKSNEEFYRRRRYSTVKLLMEDLYLEFNELNKAKNLEDLNTNLSVNLIIIRPFNVIGKYQREEFVIPKMIIDGKLEKKITVYNGEQERIFIYVDDFNKYIDELKQNIVELNLKNLIIFNLAHLKNNAKISVLALFIQKLLYDKYGFEVKIEKIDTENSENDLIVGAKKRIPDIIRLTENTKYKAEKNLKDILYELIEWY